MKTIVFEPLPQPLFKESSNLSWEPVNRTALHTLSNIFHTPDVTLAIRWVFQACSSAGAMDADTNPQGVTPNQVVNFVQSMNPQNTQEAMLALNLFALQEHQFELGIKARCVKSYEVKQAYTNMMCKVSTTMMKQAEAMAKLRGKMGNTYLQQVNVNDGGQAVVNQGR